MNYGYIYVFCLLFCICITLSSGRSEAKNNLDVYFPDMMGGGSTLIVTPAGESLLIDTGSREPQHRDAERIYKAAQFAGLDHIDYLITTHFHSDHFGGILQVSKMIPIKKFIDKGVRPSEKEEAVLKNLYMLYDEASKGHTESITAGDTISLKNDPEGKFPALQLHCLAAEKKVEGFTGDIDAPVKGFEMHNPDKSDNARSIALVLTYGKFKFFAGGDITWNVEHHLAQPTNMIGKIDLFQVTHHGLGISNNPLFLKALNPTVCIILNGPKKGPDPSVFTTLRNLPEVKAIYQIHFNTDTGPEGNTKPEFIANMKNPQQGDLIKVSVNPDEGNYTVSIGVDGPKQTYLIQK